ncbi:14236_t:CDS:1, partial [Dentiscutata erythropus]
AKQRGIHNMRVISKVTGMLWCVESDHRQSKICDISGLVLQIVATM